MVALVLAVMVSMQQVQASAEVDRRDVLFGDIVVYTVTVQASGNAPVQITNPPLVGLEIRGSADRTEVSVQEGVLTRTTIREIRLAPTRTGRVSIGPARVQLGPSAATTNSIDLVVARAEETAAATLQTHVRTLVEQHPVPQLTVENVYVETITSRESVVLGDQVEVVVVAWFPREVRSRLRTPPTLQPPQFQGAWSYPQGTPVGVAMSRRVRGNWYDLYVHHQVVFPLRPGQLKIGPATVSYSLPLSYSFLSREVRHEPQSDSVSVAVRPQPIAGRPSSFDGAAGADMRFSVAASRTDLAAGDASVLTLTLTGRGNVALWPEPVVEWPTGLRIYPEGYDVELAPQQGAMAGTKTFRYLVVADSAGSHRLSAPVYPYFDIGIGEYVTLRSSAIEFVTGPTPARAIEPHQRFRTLMPVTSRWSHMQRWVSESPPWLWLLVALAPPFLALGWLAVRRARVTALPVPPPAPDRLDRLESELNAALGVYARDVDARDEVELAAALRAAGVEEQLSLRAVQLRDRLWQAKYGPQDDGDVDALAAEVAELVHILEGEQGRFSSHAAVPMVALLLCAAAASQAAAQSAERLYEAGALRSAADSFDARVRAEPWSAAHHYNLGASLQRLGDSTRARVAWLRSARLEPRNQLIRNVLSDAEAADTWSRGLTWTSPLTPAEAFAVAGVLWLLGWAAVGLRVGRVSVAVLLGLAILSALYGGYVRTRYGRPVALVVQSDTPLRQAPYGPAPAGRTLEVGSAVLVTRVAGPWMLARYGAHAGWLLREEAVPL